MVLAVQVLLWRYEMGSFLLQKHLDFEFSAHEVEVRGVGSTMASRRRGEAPSSQLSDLYALGGVFEERILGVFVFGFYLHFLRRNQIRT